MPKPLHLSDREYRLLLHIEEEARVQQEMRVKITQRYGPYAAELNAALHEGGARVLRRLARRIRRNEVPGWDMDPESD